MSDIHERPERQALPQAENTQAVERKLTEAQDVTLSDHYLGVARAGAAEHPDHVIKAQGRAGERVALQEIKNSGGQAVDLNERDARFPIYDVGSREGVASVKVHLSEKPSLEERNQQYAREFEEAIGRGGGPIEPILGEANGEKLSPAKFNNAARHLHAMAKAGADLPPELAKSPAEAANYLRDHSTFAIPDDHAEQLRGHLGMRIK